jgi:hypothetical protein
MTPERGRCPGAQAARQARSAFGEARQHAFVNCPAALDLRSIRCNCGWRLAGRSRAGAVSPERAMKPPRPCSGFGEGVVERALGAHGLARIGGRPLQGPADAALRSARLCITGGGRSLDASWWPRSKPKGCISRIPSTGEVPGCGRGIRGVMACAGIPTLRAEPPHGCDATSSVLNARSSPRRTKRDGCARAVSRHSFHPAAVVLAGGTGQGPASAPSPGRGR